VTARAGARCNVLSAGMTDWRLRSWGEPSRWQWERSRQDRPEHPPIARRLKEEGVRPPEDLTTKRCAPIIAKSAAPEEIIEALALLAHAGDGSKRCALVRDRPTRTAMQWPSSKPASWASVPCSSTRSSTSALLAKERFKQARAAASVGGQEIAIVLEGMLAYLDPAGQER
jgi:hypothetical protein